MTSNLLGLLETELFYQLLRISEHLPLRRNREESIDQNDLEKNLNSILLHCKFSPKSYITFTYTTLRTFLAVQGTDEKETETETKTKTKTEP